MDTSRVDGVKAPLHNGTPRSHLVEDVLDDAARHRVVGPGSWCCGREHGRHRCIFGRGAADLRGGHGCCRTNAKGLESQRGVHAARAAAGDRSAARRRWSEADTRPTAQQPGRDGCVAAWTACTFLLRSESNTSFSYCSPIRGVFDEPTTRWHVHWCSLQLQ